uniref:Core shell protein Gag P30 domain-containing protein n=1 Tax=Catharus ustulatus TaxID=91951 RepID=A0A8C3V0V0_CATUS
ISGIEIPDDSPLGCLLQHWNAGNFGQELSKRKLIDFCNNVWPLYEPDGMQWPRNGTLNPDIITPLMHFLQSNEKWDEIPYLDLFYYLKDKPEWQKECGIMVLKTLKVNCEGCKGWQKEKECSVRFSEPEEDVSLLVAPSAPPMEERDSGESMPGVEREGREAKVETTDIPRTPLSERTRRGRWEVERKKKEESAHLMVPLREAVGPQGERVIVKVPFSPNDLLIWKQSAGAYREDPERTARVVKMVIKTQNPDWNDLQVLLDTIMDSTEKEMVFKAMTEKAREMIRLRLVDGTVNDLVPREDPEWDPNSTSGSRRLKAYQELLTEGIRNGIPKTLNWSKLYSVRQEKNESPSTFLERLKETARRYTNLEVEGESGKLQLALIFMGQSQEDIRKKLQKLEGEDTRNLDKLLEVAWKVYNNREKETARKQQATMLAALQQVAGNNMRGGSRGRGLRGGRGMARGGRLMGTGELMGQLNVGRGRMQLGIDQCAICKNRGHWKNECPLNQGMNSGGGIIASGDGNQGMMNNTGAFPGNPQGVAQAFMMGNYQNSS